jgi:UDP-2-acetamido-2-deoxy-ribo-hexuluronate aminotransferase
MQVPFIDLSRFTHEISAGVLEDWQRALERSEFVGGPPVQALEAKLSELLGAKQGVACASGSDALMLALRARGLCPGDRVALPNCTFWATYEAVAQLGAVPVLVDVDPGDFQLSLAALARAHERFSLRAVILVHAFGWASGNLGQFRSFCREQGIWLLEDAAQAYGVEYEGRSLFADAELATLSFYPAKVIGGSQDGGAVLVQDEQLAARIRSLANHGRRSHYSYDHVGWNSRMGGPNAYFLLRALARANDILEWRRRATAFYRQALAGEPRLTLHAAPLAVRENGYLSVATLDGPCEPLVLRLRQRGVSCARTWPETIDAQRPAALALKLEPLERSRDFTGRVFNLPVFYGITEAEQQFVVDALRAELR